MANLLKMAFLVVVMYGIYPKETDDVKIYIAIPHAAFPKP